MQGHAALAAYLMGVPVKVRLTRDESIIMHPKRHPIWMEYTVGCDENGMLTFCKGRFVGDTGAYASVGMKVLERSAGHATGAYNFPVTDIESTAVYTNNLPCGAMRGFGVNQTAFALESCIDDLCEQGGFDRWEFRYSNALDDGDMTATGQVIEAGAGAKATLEAVENEFRNAKFAGIACGIKNTGIGNGMPDSSQVTVSVVENPHPPAPPQSIGEGKKAGAKSPPNALGGDLEGGIKVVIDHGWTEMGQGVHTMAVQTLVTETGLESGAGRGPRRDRFRDGDRHDHRFSRDLADRQCHYRRLPRIQKPTWKTTPWRNWSARVMLAPSRLIGPPSPAPWSRRSIPTTATATPRKW